jgi:hypothetical protein
LNEYNRLLEGVFVKISNRAKSRELKRIDRFLIKYRDQVEGKYLAKTDKKSAFLGLRWQARRSHKVEDVRHRIFSEFVNRTARRREALQYEASASGLSL